jgi:hypothetical protein
MRLAKSYSNERDVITLACIVDLLQTSKILHCNRYSSEISADRAKKIILKMYYDGRYWMLLTSLL